jgi:hypothetical protein
MLHVLIVVNIYIEKRSMQLITKQVPDNFNLYCFGDLHKGSILHYDDGVQHLIDSIKTPYEGCKNNLAVNHGDNCEAICMDDPRYQRDTTLYDSVLAEADAVVKTLKPISKHMVCGLDGNHELKLWRTFGNLSQRIYNELNVPFGTYTARITYTFKDGSVLKHFATHGARSINSSADDAKRRLATMQLILKRLLKFKSQTCALATMGHTHKLLVCAPDPELYLDDDGAHITQHYTSPHHSGYIHHEQKWFANTGSFMKLYEMGVSGYAERFGYDPNELGYIIAMIRDRQLIDVRKVVV